MKQKWHVEINRITREVETFHFDDIEADTYEEAEGKGQDMVDNLDSDKEPANFHSSSRIETEMVIEMENWARLQPVKTESA
jgi:hypothetical protein